MANKNRKAKLPCPMLKAKFCSYKLLPLMDGDVEICPGLKGKHIPEMISFLIRKGVKIFR